MYHITPLHCHQAEQQQAYTSVGRQTVIRHLKMSPVTSLIDSVSFHKVSSTQDHVQLGVPAEGQRLLWAGCHSADSNQYYTDNTKVQQLSHPAISTFANGQWQLAISRTYLPMRELWALTLIYPAAAISIFGVNCSTSTRCNLHIAQLLIPLCKKAMQHTAESEMRCEVSASVFDIKG